ncbi:MAG: hypothetical protein ACXVYW_16215 [Oryzihumus sp.]
MSGGRTPLLSLRALRFHVPLVLGVTGCLWAGWFELGRARAGHTIAWVYVFEWPAFAVAGVVIWWRILTDRDAPRPGDRASGRGRQIPDDDPGLRAWQRYRAELEQDGAGPADEGE